MSTKSWSAIFIDPALDALSASVDTLYLCSGEPTSYSDAINFALCSTPMASADFTKGNGSVSGRRLTTATKGNVSVTASGISKYFALIDSIHQVLRYVGKSTQQTLSAGQVISIGPLAIEVKDAY